MWLAHAALRFMISEADEHTPDETGGVLLGYWRDEQPVITQALGPGPNAVHKREAFIPDYEYHEAEIDRLYSETRSWTLHYLGDWHTHPGMPGYLSRRDVRTLRRIATYRLARVPRPVMLILSYGPEWRLNAWQGEVTGALACFRRITTMPLKVALFTS